MRRVKATTVRLDDYIEVDLPYKAYAKGYVDSIIHTSRETIEVTLVDADTWPQRATESTTRYVTLDVSPGWTDYVNRRTS